MEKKDLVEWCNNQLFIMVKGNGIAMEVQRYVHGLKMSNVEVRWMISKADRDCCEVLLKTR